MGGERRRFFTIGLVILAALAFSARAAWAEETRTVQPGAGLYLKQPDGWTVLSQSPSDPKLQKKGDPGPRPLLVLGKHGASFSGFNPKIRVFYQAIPADSQKLTPRELIQLVLPKGTSSGITLEGEVRELTVSGLPAAEASWLYTLPGGNGAPLPLRARVVLVRQGDHFFTLGMSSPREGPDDVRPQFQAFLDQMMIGPAPR